MTDLLAQLGTAPPPPGYTHWSLHDAEGRVHATGLCAVMVVDAYRRDGLTLIRAKADPAAEWVDPAAGVRPRPRMNPTLTTHGPGRFTLANLPARCVVEVRTATLGSVETFEVLDGVFDYEDLATAHTVTLLRFPFLEHVVEVVT
ncbi:hypothetical protein [Azospirillum argentinense]|uniref:hypothetical protein n=1 Tax=Azospirillum argentinense TaxID=2970906 RepID=UPI0032DF1A1B